MLRLVILAALTVVLMALRIDVALYGAWTGRPFWAIRVRVAGHVLPEINAQVLARRRAAKEETAWQIVRRLASEWQGTNGARRFLQRHIRLVLLEGEARVGTTDAARTALVSGAIRGLAAALPGTWCRKARLRVIPDFTANASTGKVRCIITFRLGTLWAAALLLLRARVARRWKQAQNKEA